MAVELQAWQAPGVRLPPGPAGGRGRRRHHGDRLPINIPPAAQRHQEAHPLSPQTPKSPTPVVPLTVITLRQMCAKYWLEKVQYLLKADIPKYSAFAVQRFLADLPRDLRARMLHNALKAGGLHLASGVRELASVNRALVLLTHDIQIYETVYISLPRAQPDGEWPLDIEFLLRNGDGLLDMVVTLPQLLTDPVRKIFTDLLRTCRNLKKVRIVNACDDAMVLVTRHCRHLVELDVSNAEGVSNDGVNRAIVNFNYADLKTPSQIKKFDVGNTNVNEDGICAILTRLPGLASLGCVDIPEPLGIVDEVVGPEALQACLEEVTIRAVTVNRLQALARLCPAVSSINAIINHPGATINDLRLIANLKHLRLSVREPYLLSPQALYDFVWALGPRLLTLRVDGDVYWEADIGILASSMPNLEELALPAITVPTKESLDVLKAKDTPGLRRLRILEVDCMTGAGPKAWAKDYDLVRKGIVAALKRCTALKRLICRPTNLVESDLMEILAVNRMEQLESLELYNSMLGLDAAKLLMDTCTNLHVMKGMRSWRGLTLTELVKLRAHTRGHRRAAELKVLP
ncbi:unnamed protein product [Meganyctiphanes norvegica]|uniref:Uncharacterized protein n=1 Tax=Meganyctiphanes norvegica TaxID=48144 RepID=A0AAV2QUY7_MEGNR